MPEDAQAPHWTALTCRPLRWDSNAQLSRNELADA